MSETDPFYSEEAEGMSKRTQLEEYFSQSLEVELLLRLCPDDEDTIYQIVDLLVDTCATNRKLLRIAGDDKPAEVVRSRFMKLNADHIRFVLKCLAENSSPIRNMKQYPDSFTLFGFATKQERELYRLLITVSGVRFWGMMIAKEVDVCADYRK